MFMLIPAEGQSFDTGTGIKMLQFSKKMQIPEFNL